MRRDDRARALADSYGIDVVSAQAAAGQAQTLVITVKPQDMATLLDEIAPILKADQLVISVAAGITTRFIESRLPVDAAVVRVMSNTPVLVDEAMSLISAGRFAGEQHLRLTEDLLRPVGKVLRIPESQQDAATALSGSGPAYVYFLVEAMVDAGILLGMPRSTALEMVKQAVYGAATMLRESGEHPVILREAVTSPGGTTINAIRELERHGVRAAFLAAIEAARDRGRARSGLSRCNCWGRPVRPVGQVGKIRLVLGGCPFASTNYARYGRDWCAEYRLAQRSAGEGYRWLQRQLRSVPCDSSRLLRWRRSCVFPR